MAAAREPLPTGNLSLAANAATDGGLTKLSLGTLILSGANTYNGGTIINAGVVQFGRRGLLFPPTGLVTINAAGALSTGATGFAYTTVTSALTGGKIATTSTGAVTVSAASAEAIDFATPGYKQFDVGASANAVFTGTITPGTSGYHLGGGGATLTLSTMNTLTGANAHDGRCDRLDRNRFAEQHQ